MVIIIIIIMQKLCSHINIIGQILVRTTAGAAG